METRPTRIKTTHYKSLLPSDVADSLYNHLLKETKWEESIKARAKGYKTSRLGKALDIGDDERVDETVFSILEQIKSDYDLLLLGIYLNYYRDGNDMTPMHSHPKQCQIVISLGATRILTVGKKEYSLANGDVITFGSSQHGVPLQPEVKDGRISIALFTLPL